MPTSRSFDGSTIVVLGATGAFGSRIAARLSAEGARVVATGRDRDRLNEVDAPVRVVGDLREEAFAKRIRDAVGGPIDGVINAAGVVAFGALADTPDEVIAELFATNVTGPLQVLHGLIPDIADEGFIAAITGVIAAQPMAGLTPYSASKAALAAALVALRREVRRQKIDVIDLQPPHTETGLATRPLSGEAPGMPEGADPDAVVGTILDAIRQGTRLVAADDFS